MRVVLAVIILWSTYAAADDFFDLQRETVGVLGDHLRLSVPKAMEIDPKGQSALLDYGTARFGEPSGTGAR